VVVLDDDGVLRHVAGPVYDPSGGAPLRSADDVRRDLARAAEAYPPDRIFYVDESNVVRDATGVAVNRPEVRAAQAARRHLALREDAAARQRNQLLLDAGAPGPPEPVSDAVEREVERFVEFSGLREPYLRALTQDAGSGEWRYADDASAYAPGVFAGKRIAGEGSSEFDARRRRETLENLQAAYSTPELDPAKIYYEDLDTGLIYDQSGRVVNAEQVRAAKDAERRDLLRRSAAAFAWNEERSKPGSTLQGPPAPVSDSVERELDRFGEVSKSPGNLAGVRYVRAVVPGAEADEWVYADDGSRYVPGVFAGKRVAGEGSSEFDARRRQESLASLRAGY
ncbi:MAG: hypothetical protein ACRCYQ_16680, partial [Nocardioides sp.]